METRFVVRYGATRFLGEFGCKGRDNYPRNCQVVLRTERGVDQLIPGLTGWAQINGRDSIPIPEKVELDAWYLHNCSFWLDLKILFMTMFKVVRTEDISH